MTASRNAGPGYAWIVTDLDGTLVDRNLGLVPRSAEALRRYRECGGTVVIATGRNEESAAPYHRELGLDTPMILYNGARITDPRTGDRLVDLDLGPVWPPLRDLVLPALPVGVGAVGFSGHTAHVLRDAPVLADYARRDRIVLLGDPPEEPPTKVMLISGAQHPSRLADLTALHCPKALLVQSEDTYLEVLPPGAGKEAALRELAVRYGMDTARIAAIGDNPNDTGMVRLAGLGAAVGDGHPQVLAAADIVVTSCSQGAVADLVGRILDGPLP
ncbi:HAD-IIB family hydrolase [Streptomyces lancefieldiae]|uniref:HAD-IIB family hydrolase n=1 Tax=Streptomyces lancefieldiae TaxID=3075520 RepID=A0ABU3AHV2_9ACTN|nr:HAD-IIB family hydrolase [Streptomyces sp. DSM 40712]MDT0609107.1 HAD-IIB family hydrolase [Streptomyces sp. DSM 40712]